MSSYGKITEIHRDENIQSTYDKVFTAEVVMKYILRQ